MANVGKWFIKSPNAQGFVVKNIAPFGKRVRVFNYPISNGLTRDLLAIPGISEEDIRHSLLKGELFIKLKHNELIVLHSDIQNIMFNESHKLFLKSIGVVNGLEIIGMIGSDPNPGPGSGDGYFTEDVHASIRQLIHFIDNGPAEGFASGAFREILPFGDPFPTSVIWWESSSKINKIVELLITRDGEQKPTVEVWNMYDEDGSTILTTVTDNINYSGQVETTRMRTIS